MKQFPNHKSKPFACIEQYQNRLDLALSNPEIKKWLLLYQAPRGQSYEKQLEGVTAAIQKRGGSVAAVYKVGDFFYIPAQKEVPCLDQ